MGEIWPLSTTYHNRDLVCIAADDPTIYSTCISIHIFLSISRLSSMTNSITLVCKLNRVCRCFNHDLEMPFNYPKCLNMFQSAFPLFRCSEVINSGGLKKDRVIWRWSDAWGNDGVPWVVLNQTRRHDGVMRGNPYKMNPYSLCSVWSAESMTLVIS